MTIILLACKPCEAILNCLEQVLYLGRAPRTKETLPDFHEWCRVTRHPRVFSGVDGLSTDTPVLGHHNSDRQNPVNRREKFGFFIFSPLSLYRFSFPTENILFFAQIFDFNLIHNLCLVHIVPCVHDWFGFVSISKQFISSLLKFNLF